MLASFYKVTSRQKQCPPAKSILKSKAIQGVSLILYGIEKKKKNADSYVDLPSVYVCGAWRAFYEGINVTVCWLTKFC